MDFQLTVIVTQSHTYIECINKFQSQANVCQHFDWNTLLTFAPIFVHAELRRTSAKDNVARDKELLVEKVAV